MSQHVELLGDPVLGPQAFARFLPSRINLKGEAVDGRGMPTQTLACPHCHLIIPRAFLTTRPMFFSIIGAPASGKSNFLASMTWQLRHLLPGAFGIHLTDADPAFNRILHEYEETLYLQDDPDRLVSIRKTELQGELYDQVRFGEQIVTLPRPFIFALRSSPKPATTQPPTVPPTPPPTPRPARLELVCLYDNAGEHFQPEMDTASAPGTRHLAHSRALFFLYDPTQHPRIRERCRGISEDPQLNAFARTQRQETLLTEAASRVRRHTGLAAEQRHKATLIVVVTKSDVWGSLIGAHPKDLEGEPIVAGKTVSAVDVPKIERVSALLRKFLLAFTPEFVAAAEDFCEQVVYMPVSPLGHGPSVQQDTGMLGIRPAEVKPRWVTAPMLYALAQSGRGLVAVARAATAASSPPKAPQVVVPKPARLS